MKKIFIMCLIALGFMFSSCTETRHIVTKERYDNCIKTVNQELSKNGFELVGTKSLIDNGYGSYITVPYGNEYLTYVDKAYRFIDTYKFKKNNGDEIKYSTSYSLYSLDKYICVQNNGVFEYEFSNPNDYEKYEDIISQMNYIPTQEVKRIDDGKTASAIIVGIAITGAVVYMVYTMAK